MTQTADPATDTQTRVDAWLSDFDEALSARDVERAAGMFATDCFWRDLVAFTWNITTVEGRDGVAGLLRATLDGTAPSGSRTTEPPDEADGVTTAWIEFETAVGRGKGLLRLRGRGGMDAAHHALRAQGPRGDTGTRRPMGAEHGANKDRETWAEKREQEEAESSATTTQPYVLVVGGGQGGIALGARLRQLGVPTIVIDKHAAARRPVAQPLQVAVPARPDLVRPPALHQVPRQLAGVLPQGQDRRLARVVHQGDGGQLLVQHRGEERAYDEEAGEWTVEVEREGQPLVLRPKQLVFATGMSGKPQHPRVAGMDIFRGDQHHSSAHPGPDAYAGKKAVVIGSNNSAFDICGALWENGADVTMVQRSSTHIVQSGQPDGHRAGRPLLRAGGRGRSDDREGRPDLRLAALPDPARVPDPRLRGDGRAGQGLLRPAREGRASSTTGATTARGCS